MTTKRRSFAFLDRMLAKLRGQDASDARLVEALIVRSAIEFGIIGETVEVPDSPPMSLKVVEYGLAFIDASTNGTACVASVSIVVKDLPDGKATIAWTFTPKNPPPSESKG